MALCYIGLGTNLSEPLAQAMQARAQFSAHAQWQLTAVSALYQSRPMGPQDQPDYLNAVLAIETALSPLALLDALQAIENTQGRVRLQRWGARTLDLDLLLYGNAQINETRLIVPHYGIKEREFVLLPLAEIAPQLVLPDGSCVSTLAQAIDDNGMEVYKTANDW